MKDQEIQGVPGAVAAETTTTTPRRPVLRYHGGKWLLAPWIVSMFPPHRIFTEVLYFNAAAASALQGRLEL